MHYPVLRKHSGGIDPGSSRGASATGISGGGPTGASSGGGPTGGAGGGGATRAGGSATGAGGGSGATGACGDSTGVGATVVDSKSTSNSLPSAISTYLVSYHIYIINLKLTNYSTVRHVLPQLQTWPLNATE